tara:strand:+ start:1406 stop:1642 length:237 start_codon:yes stop_codon:yes gene_type:complete
MPSQNTGAATFSPLHPPPFIDQAEAKFATHHAMAADNWRKSAEFIGPARIAPTAQQKLAINCITREIFAAQSFAIFVK